MVESIEETTQTTFDQLVSDGVIVYGQHTAIEHAADGYPIEFRLCPALSKKPHTVGAALDPAFDKSRKWGPGSDMYCPDERLILTRLNGTHELTLNLFCVDRPQLLMLTLDSYRRQHEPLDQDDFTVTLEVLKRYPSMYVIFNGGEQAGCSRVHKHLQGLRGPPHAFKSLVSGSNTRVPFKFFRHHFNQSFHDVSAGNVLEVYNSLLSQSRVVLGLSMQENCPHNVVMWDDWLIVIPRRKGSFQGANGNAGGMLGSIWVTSEEHVDKWTKVGCANVLRELGVPA